MGGPDFQKSRGNGVFNFSTSPVQREVGMDTGDQLTISIRLWDPCSHCHLVSSKQTLKNSAHGNFQEVGLLGKPMSCQQKRQECEFPDLSFF